MQQTPTCHWDDCGLPVAAGGSAATGADPLQALFQQILVDHVRTPNPDAAASSVQLPPILPPIAATPFPTPPSLPVPQAFARAFSPTICEWDHCHQDVDTSVLFNHLLTEHLHPADLHLSHSLPIPPPMQPMTPQSPAPSGLVCQWADCSVHEPFESNAALKVRPAQRTLVLISQAHVESAHVGSGQSSYRCQWRGCPRAEPDAKPFPQRQKVRRRAGELADRADRPPPPRAPRVEDAYLPRARLRQDLRRADGARVGASAQFERALTPQHMKVHAEGHEPRRRRTQSHRHGHEHTHSHASSSRSVRGVDASRRSSISVTDAMEVS